MSTEREPIEVEVEAGERALRIVWDDGRVSRYPFNYLRGYCPCAVCQGHGGGVRFVPVGSPSITRIDEVGNYAFNIVWRDVEGMPLHTTGIYAFEYLRELDPADGNFPMPEAPPHST